MKYKRFILGLVALATFQILAFLFPSLSLAGNLTSAKDTLQSSRMSFYGRVSPPTSAGSSHIWIYTSTGGGATSISTGGLKPGDTLTIGTGTYTIASIIDDDEFTTTTTLASGDADDTDVIYFRAKPGHIITFNTASAINGGFFQVLIPAASSGSNNSNFIIPSLSLYIMFLNHLFILAMTRLKMF